MRNLLALLGLAIVAFAIIGYYQNWYFIEKTPDGWYRITLDEPKVKADLKGAEQKVEDAFKK